MPAASQGGRRAAGKEDIGLCAAAAGAKSHALFKTRSGGISQINI